MYLEILSAGQYFLKKSLWIIYALVLFFSLKNGCYFEGDTWSGQFIQVDASFWNPWFSGHFKRGNTKTVWID